MLIHDEIGNALISNENVMMRNHRNLNCEIEMGVCDWMFG